jgi:hypothetical protein
MRAPTTIAPDMSELVMKIRLSRVFVLRIWLGVRLLHIAMWVIGGRAEVEP